MMMMNNTNPNTVSEESIREWMKLEFEQNFIQLRDRDDKIISMTKFFGTFLLSLCSVALGLLGLEEIQVHPAWIGALLLAGAIVGEIVLLWLISFREYFVTCARQLNALRARYVSNLATEKLEIAIQSTNSNYPEFYNPRSAQTAIWWLMLLLVSTIGGVGTYVILRGFSINVTWSILGLVAILSFVVILNVRFAYSRIELQRAVIVDIDNTLLRDVPRKLAVLRKHFNKEVEQGIVEDNYNLDGILSPTEQKKFQKKFQSSEYAVLDEPLPGSVRVLTDLSQSVEIIYLTGRPPRMRKVTVARLRELGFPLCTQRKKLIMKRGKSNKIGKWKQRKLKRLAKQYQLVIGIGDAPSDCMAYSCVGMPTLCVLGYWSKEKIQQDIGSAANNVSFTRNWNEVESLLNDMIH